MIGCEEMMRDALVVEVIRGEEVPSPLTEACLKMMRAPVCEEIDAVEVCVELFEAEECRPNLENKKEIICICFLAVAEEVQIFHLFN